MSVYVPRHFAASTLFQAATMLVDGACVLRHAAERLDRFLANRRKAIDDRRVLAEMSERELRDIGVCNAHLWQNSGSRPAYERGEWRGII
jgi:uncharacterized protein YjiS (DUF1127 family)